MQHFLRPLFSVTNDVISIKPNIQLFACQYNILCKVQIFSIPIYETNVCVFYLYIVIHCVRFPESISLPGLNIHLSFIYE